MGTHLPLPNTEAETPQFSAHICCGQTAGWVKIPLVGLDTGYIVLDGDPAPPPPKGHTPKFFGPFIAAKRLDG